MTKPGLTPEQHTQLGAELFATRQTLTKAYVMIANAYPQNLPAVNALRSAAIKVDKTRSDLDSLLARDNPDAFDPAIYYPGGARD